MPSDPLEHPEWKTNITDKLQAVIERMVVVELLERIQGELRLTELGFACGSSSLTIESALYLIETLKRYQTAGLTAFELMAMVLGLSEMDQQYMPMLKRGEKEKVWPNHAIGIVDREIVRSYQRNVSGSGWDYYQRSKRLCILQDWISGRPTAEIESIYTITPFQAVGAGDIRGTADATRFHLSSASSIASLVLLDAAPDPEAIDLLLRQLETGVPERGIELLDLPFQLTRGEYLAIIDAGATKPNEFWQLNQEALVNLFTDEKLAEINQWRSESD